MSPEKRPSLRTGNTLDASQLSGSLRADGVVELQVDEERRSNGATPPLPTRLDMEDVHAYQRARAESSESNESVYESYDAQRLHPDTIVSGSSGGQVEIDLAADDKLETRHTPDRRGSIQVQLERTDRRGRYILTAEDPEIRDIIKSGFDKHRASSLPKSPGIKLKELVFTRRFTTFDRQNPSHAESPFLGFYILFWIAMALLLVQVAAQNHRLYGNPLGEMHLLKLMFSRELIALGLTDGVMYASTAIGLGLQLVISNGYLSWNRSGWIIQNIWQTLYLGALVSWTFYRDWPWTHTIFTVLHGLVFVMKQHSYAFYNGYLSQVYRRRQRLERYLRKLEKLSPVSSPVSSPVTNREHHETSSNALHVRGDIRHRRQSSLSSKTDKVNLSREPDEVTSIASAISSNMPLDSDQMDTYRNILVSELEELDTELRGKCSVSKNFYPSNLTILNWAEWTCMPTLVYELEYPRQERINWAYVAEKTGAIFGVLIIMQTISQTFIYPPMKEAYSLKEQGISLEQRWQEFPYLVLDMLFPLLLEQLLTWYLIWECVLNVLAELTYFADRGFYGNWWSSVSWDQYARDWNRPVHNFLLRHVYHSSISTFHLSKTTATFVTFLLSALVHELLMFVLFKKVRGYLFTSQLLQMPLVMLSRTKFLKGRNVLGNVIFWFGLFVGPAFLTSLYLVV